MELWFHCFTKAHHIYSISLLHCSPLIATTSFHEHLVAIPNTVSHRSKRRHWYKLNPLRLSNGPTSRGLLFCLSPSARDVSNSAVCRDRAAHLSLERLHGPARQRVHVSQTQRQPRQLLEEVRRMLQRRAQHAAGGAYLRTRPSGHGGE